MVWCYYLVVPHELNLLLHSYYHIAIWIILLYKLYKKQNSNRNRKYTAEKSLIFQWYGLSMGSNIQSLKWKSRH